MVLTANRLSEVQYDEARRRLQNWRTRGESAGIITQFTQYLARRDYFCLERIPDGFLWGWQTALRDFRREYPQVSQARADTIRACLFPIARAIFPKEFFDQVRNAHIQLMMQSPKEPA